MYALHVCFKKYLKISKIKDIKFVVAFISNKSKSLNILKYIELTIF